jgi:hypothetical protein
MKKVIQMFALAALTTTMLALPALAQTPTAASTSAAASSQDDAQAKADLYKKFTDNVPRTGNPGNPAAAYEAGKEYLAKYAQKDGPNDQYVAYIQKWVNAYDKLARRQELIQDIVDKKYNEAFTLSKQVLTDYPDDAEVLYRLVGAGFAALSNKNETNNADAIAAAKKLIPLVQNGKNPDPSKSKEEVLGNLNYAIGVFSLKTQPAEAANYFINAAQFGGSSKKDPKTYVYLADIYEKGEYTTLATQYSTQCKTPEQVQSADCVALKAKVDQIVDHIIDALARAIAYYDASPNTTANKDLRAGWMESLTTYYKYRNNGTDTGLKELIAGITNRPLPKPGEPVTPALFPTTPATTSSTTAPAQSTGTTTTPSKTTTTTQGSKTTTQPAGKTAGTKPSPKRAHN